MASRKLFNACKNDVNWFINDFAKSIKKASVLDVGCGSGKYTSLFCRNGNVVVGLDLQNTVGEEYVKFQFIEGDAAKVAFTNSVLT